MFKAAILGAPASGKGTISARIVKRFDMMHIASGDILRHHIRDNTEVGKEAKKYVEAGKLVPDEVMMNLVLSELVPLTYKNWLLDGFPRTRKQAEILYRKFPINLAINLAVPFEVIIQRVKGRWVHVPSGRVYNDDFNAPKEPGKDDVTGEPLEQRPDDRPEVMEKRLKIYCKTVEPVLEFYKEKEILQEFHGKTSDEIWPKVEKVLTDLMEAKKC